MTVSDRALTLNDLLHLSGISQNDVLVFRHKPYEPDLNRVFDWIVGERRDLFDCYQSNHGSRTESALSRAKHLASFVRHTPGTALFAGFYDVASSRLLSPAACLERPLHQELMALGMSGYKAIEDRARILEFDLKLTDWRADWIGKLVIRWPGLERSWYRWADRNSFEIESIAPENLFARAMPSWDQLCLNWNQLAVLPASWRAQLRNWRGIYLIIDQSDGRQYVGSACGSENMLQRWLEYSRTGHGGNVLLKQRNPADFRFSILQMTAHDLPETVVVQLEQSWKNRLRTRSPNGLNEN
jgi:hypothetical protein